MSHDAHGRRQATAGFNQARTDKGKGVASKYPADIAVVDDATGDEKDNVVAERERRRKMNDLFTELHALLPNLSDKSNKASIVEEAACYIKILERTVDKLERRKREKELARAAASSSASAPAPAQAVLPVAANGASWPPAAAAATSPLPGAVDAAALAAVQPFQTWSGPNVVVSVFGDVACINVCAARGPGVFATVLAVLENHRIEVITAQVASDTSRTRRVFMIYTRMNGVSSHQLGVQSSFEDRYKAAAAEIMAWLAA